MGFLALGLALVVSGNSGGCAGAPKSELVPKAEISAPPAAEALIQKMIDATGGPGAYAQQQSRFTSGKVRIPKVRVVLAHTAWAQRPNKTYDLMESPVIGKIESGCDGSTVWELSEEGGAKVKTGSERAGLLRDADFDNWPNWKNYYKSATTAGEDTVAGQAAWKVEMVPIEGPPQTKWMDQTTGLLLKTMLTRETQAGAIPVEIFYLDYREVCGMKMPFRTREVALTGLPEIVSTIDSVACNPPVPEDRFELPAQITALLEMATVAEELEQESRKPPALANDYLSIVLFALNRSSGGLRARGRPALERHQLRGTKVSSDISADGFTLVPMATGTGIVFGTEWTEPLSKILGSRGDFPEMTFRNGSAEIQEQAGQQTLRIAEGTEMQVQGATWNFQQGEWKLARSPE